MYVCMYVFKYDININLNINININKHIYIYEPPPKKNTTYVLEGHWFMEIDRTCLKHTVRDGTFPG